MKMFYLPNRFRLAACRGSERIAPNRQPARKASLQLCKRRAGRFAAGEDRADTKQKNPRLRNPCESPACRRCECRWRKEDIDTRGREAQSREPLSVKPRKPQNLRGVLLSCGSPVPLHYCLYDVPTPPASTRAFSAGCC